MTTALYRRYRPETFAEVIGQDHVTAPLRHALRSGQVNHAYLFSGPRGCGKTSSARILARVLNCAQNTVEHPTDTPCGVCPSCIELATGGPGSLDVVEIDAASHGGVDDARELRERATFAPARDRFKVFILDEAHMVTPQGFNALLKIVEEPPPHVKFVFATTEPDKVIGTIRSRTHHYPFRLVPPDVLVPYLEQLCVKEGVPVGAGVLSLVVRAGGGSVRDSLSVLDQLVAGSGPEGLTYEPAVALLGYTPASLLDDLVEALAARDGGAAFRVVERVIATGHEPRRFVEDLLERLRDLIVIAAAGERATAALRDVPADQLTRMQQQSTHLGPAELSRSADLTDAALTEMVGATSPRLQLELLMARLLLPSADDSRTGFGARLDRLERGAPASAGVASGSPSPQEERPVAVAVDRPVADRPAVERPTVDRPAVEPPDVRPASAQRDPADVSEVGPIGPDDTEPPAPSAGPGPVAQPQAAEPDRAAPSRPAPAIVAAGAVDPPRPGSTRTALDTEMLRRRWPEVLEVVRRLRKFTHALVQDNALPLTLDETTLRLGFAHPGHVTAFRGGQHAEVVVRALHEALGVEVVRVEAVLQESEGTPTVSADSGPVMPSRAQAEASWQTPVGPTAVPASAPGGQQTTARRPSAGRPAPSSAGKTDPAPSPEPPDDPTDEPPPPPWDDEMPPDDRGAPARQAPPAGGAGPARPARGGDLGRVATASAGGDGRAWSHPGPTPDLDDEPSPDDPDLAGSGLVGAPLIAQILGGRVIDEQLDGPS